MPSSAARQRLHRERRRRKLRCITLDIRAQEVTELLLAPTDQGSRTAIGEALHRHLDQTLTGAA
jgi:hypothetical protein